MEIRFIVDVTKSNKTKSYESPFLMVLNVALRARLVSGEHSPGSKHSRGHEEG